MAKLPPSRQVVLLCPVCGSDQFKHDESDRVECARCGRIATKEDLIKANKEAIEAKIDETKTDVINEIRMSIRKNIAKTKRFRPK